MLKYNLAREHEFYTIIPLGQIAIKNKIAQKRLNIRMALQTVALKVYLTRKRKGQYAQYIYSHTDLVTEEDMKDLLEQLPVLMILLGDFNVHNLL